MEAQVKSKRPLAIAWYGALAPPIAWTVHFIVGYGFAEAYCSTGSGDVTTVVLAVKGGFGVLIALAGVAAFVTFRRVKDDRLADPRGWIFVLAVIGLLGSLLFGFATILEAVPVLPLDPCSPG